jgi:hypothetical protein
MMGQEWVTCAWSSYHTLGPNISGSYTVSKEKLLKFNNQPCNNTVKHLRHYDY